MNKPGKPKRLLYKACGLLCGLLAALPLFAEDVIESRLMGLELASDIAQGAIEACRKDGYQVAVVVVDRSGRIQVVLRDVYASHQFTILAEGKAQAAVLANTSSGALRSNRADMVSELNLLPDVFVLRGGLPIQAAGSTIGGVGVSGAPGGDLDEACAQRGIDAVADRLAFAE